MDFSKLQRGEIAALAGALLLMISVFLSWYGTNTDNPNAQVDGKGGPHAAAGITPGDGTYSAWQVHSILRILLLLGAIAPFVLAWIILREHQLSWPRGEMTAVIGIALTGMIFYVGIIDRPGDPSGEISLKIGWFVALLGALMITVGSAVRSGEHERRRKPPGVL